MNHPRNEPAADAPKQQFVTDAPPPPLPDTGETVPAQELARNEKWFVPFVVIPLGIALSILSIIGVANFLLGRGGPRTLDELLDEVKGGGANARKQAAFHLARNIAEEVDKNNKTLVANRPVDPGAVAPPRAAWPRRELAKIEQAYDLTKDDHETRRFLVAALGLVGDDETADFLGRKLNETEWKDPDGTLRVAVLHGMARICSDSSLPAFDAEYQRATTGDPDAGTLNILAAGYGNLTNPKATERLAAILQFTAQRSDAPSPAADKSRGTTWREVRWTAAVNLAKRKSIDPASAKLTIPVLISGIEDVHADAFRAENERLFHGAGGSGGFLPAGVTTQADGNRESAAQQLIAALVFLDAKEAIPTLKKIAGADPNLKIRSSALEALASLDPKNAPATNGK